MSQDWNDWRTRAEALDKLRAFAKQEAELKVKIKAMQEQAPKPVLSQSTEKHRLPPVKEQKPEESELDRFKREFLEAVAGKAPAGVAVVGVLESLARHELRWSRFERAWCGDSDRNNDQMGRYEWNGYDLGRELRAESEKRWELYQIEQKRIELYGFKLRPDEDPVYRREYLGEWKDSLEERVSAMLARPFGDAPCELRTVRHVWGQSYDDGPLPQPALSYSGRAQYIRARLVEIEAKRSDQEARDIGWAPYEDD